MMTSLTPEEESRLAAQLRPGESPLWQGKGNAVAAASAPGFLARLLGRNPAPQSAVLYAITPKRVLALPPQGEPQEWFLMLGLVQDFREYGNGCGDIVFDYAEESGERVPRGIIGVADAAHVHTLLRDAIDAAYNASPWSV